MVDDVASRKTYRYLRIGIVAAVVLLGASVLLERSKVDPDCWQTSISAYYYTPARAVFVGALMAIGLSLIVIKGNTSWEDLTFRRSAEAFRSNFFDCDPKPAHDRRMTAMDCR